MGYLTIFLLIILSVRLNVSQYYRSQKQKDKIKSLESEILRLKNKEV